MSSRSLFQFYRKRTIDGEESTSASQPGPQCCPVLTAKPSGIELIRITVLTPVATHEKPGSGLCLMAYISGYMDTIRSLFLIASPLYCCDII